jgi:hypothetical protein
MTPRPSPTPRASRHIGGGFHEQHNSPPTRRWAPTTNPGIPTKAVAPRLPWITGKGLSFCRGTFRRMAGPLPASLDSRLSSRNSPR